MPSRHIFVPDSGFPLSETLSLHRHLSFRTKSSEVRNLKSLPSTQGTPVLSQLEYDELADADLSPLPSWERARVRVRVTRNIQTMWNHPRLPSAPSAVTAPNLTAKNAWTTMSVSRKRSPADTPRPAKPCETNRERHRGKSEHAKSSQTVSPPRRLSGASPRIRFNTPLPNGSSGARQFENGRKRGGSDQFSNCLIFSNCLAPEPSPSSVRK